MADILVTVLAIMLIIGILTLYVMFLITQQNILKTIHPDNRLMSPGQVWLQLIPLYSYVWQFIVVTRISDSIRLEFQSRQTDSILGFSDAQAVEITNTRPAYGIGIAAAVLDCCTVITPISPFVGIASFVCIMLYWKKLLEFKRLIDLKPV